MDRYDAAIIGGGVTGAAAAWTLSRYRLRVVLLEKEADTGFGVSKANSGIIHAGFHYPVSKTLKGRLEILGNLMFDSLQYELGFPFRRCGILVAAFKPEDIPEMEKLYWRGLENRVPRLEFCGRGRMLELEPKLRENVIGGIFAPTGGVIEPYRYVYALVEAAALNGADVLTSFKVANAVRTNDFWRIRSETGATVEAKYAVNAAGLFADDVSKIFGAENFTIRPRKGEEFLLDRRSEACPSKVVFPAPSAHSKGVLVIPTVEGTTMIGPTAELVDDKLDAATDAAGMDKVFELAGSMVRGISRKDLITSFSGSRPTLDTEDFFIAPSKLAPCFIQAAGIQSPGLTASPAVGGYIRDLLKKDGLELIEKREPRRVLPAKKSLRTMTPREADALHNNDPAATNIICRCESVSEAEIVEAIRHGHTTLDGIKFYTRAGMGRCQGGFCTYKIMKIIARETGVDYAGITKRGPGSELVAGRLGGRDLNGGKAEK